ncbi:MAG: hypothetical protein QOJ76_3217 [Acidobacteriota bacterium]|nr:hypothetical protein [Acidobacteriota bacterium]
MQCAACNEEYPEAFDGCPLCRVSEPAQTASLEASAVEVHDAPHPARQADAPAMTDNSNVSTRTTQGANNSTLIEFPGVNRNRPAWRKELSERFREIQQRRARDTDPEAEDSPRRPSGQTFSAPADDARAAATPANPSEATAKQLGLVPTPDEPVVNPLVAAALRRIERAHRESPAPRHRSGRAHAATAAARVVEEQPEQFDETAPAAQPSHPERNDGQGTAPAKRTARRADRTEAEAETARPSSLVVVQTKQSARQEQTQQALKAEPATLNATMEQVNASATTTSATTASAAEVATAEALKKQKAAPVAGQAAQVSAATVETGGAFEAQGASRQPRHINGVLDEFWLERQGIELLPKVATAEVTYDDRAPRSKRLTAALVDLLAVAFLSAPFAAAIELTISNWGDPRVSGSMALIAALVMFLYHTCSVALAGRTLGMSLCGLHAVDAGTASVPTTGQCMRRAFVYILSLATFGLGILYSLFDAEGRTVHDILSGTVVVRK